MPPLPPVAFTCPDCPKGTVCGPCAPGDAIAPDAETYIAVGAPASCPATCPHGSPTKAQLAAVHGSDKRQLPVDLGNAAKLSRQNDRNVTVHVKHHHKGARPGAWTGEVNVTFTSDEPAGTPTANVSTSSSSTSEVSTTTTTTTTTSSTDYSLDYDYLVYDYVSSTTTTTETGGKHHTKKKVPLLAEAGKQRQHKHESGPPHSTTTKLPDGVTQKKMRVPGVPPGQPKPIIDDADVTPTDASPYIKSETQLIKDGVNMSGRVVVRPTCAAGAAALGFAQQRSSPAAQLSPRLHCALTRPGRARRSRTAAP